MKPFRYRAVPDVPAALSGGSRDGSKFIAGGTTLLDLWKLGAVAPDELLDINSLPLAAIERSASGLRLGALARMSDVAAHPEVARDFPLIATALLESASPQIRNMASLGGNLLQRPRSSTYRGPDPHAVEPPGRGDAIFGVGPASAAPHPSDLAVALVALEASLVLASPKGERTVAVEEFYRLPGTTPDRLTALEQGELITAIVVPERPWARRSTYVKVRDRSSYQFALVSAAVALEVEAGSIKAARVAAGGVATRPWRLPRVEAALLGKPPVEASYQEAAKLAGDGAATHAANAYKVELLERTVVRALAELGGAE